MSDQSFLSVIDLPLASVARIVKTSIPLNQSSNHPNHQIKLSKDVKSALCRAGGIFALYLANSAIESAKSSKRLTVMPDDVIAALEEIEMDPIIEPCLAFGRQGGKKVRSRSDKAEPKGSKKTSKQTSQTGQKKKAPAKRKAPAGESAASKKKKKVEVEPEPIEDDDFEAEHQPEQADEQEGEDEIVQDD